MGTMAATGFTPILSGDAKATRNKQKTRAARVVSLYERPPPYDAALEELEAFSLDRLKVLRGIERLRLSNASEAELRQKTKELLRKYLSGDELRKDKISHFMLRLAYCQTKDNRDWLVDKECELFRVRFEELVHKEQKDFLQDIELQVGLVDQEEFERVKGSLAAAHGGKITGTHREFFKVPFEAVPSLVATRRVFVNRGWAYVGAHQMAPLVVGRFKEHLAKALQITAKAWPHVAATDESNRLAPIVSFLSKQYQGSSDYTEVQTSGNSVVTLDEIPNLAKRHFPMCMKHLHASLMSNNHLKHQGRMQFGLFLKGIGLPLEQALQFWKTAFAPKVPGDKFEKQYAYNVRHNYGKEGKRADYTPYSCMKVISTTPGSGEHHGCPYKTFSESSLRVQLQQLQITGSDQRQVLELSKNHHYQLACGKVLQLTHNGFQAEEGINHPNQYYKLAKDANCNC